MLSDNNHAIACDINQVYGDV